MRWMVLGMAMVASAFGVFVPPQEDKVPFRRDKLPVDVGTMTGLSQQLVTLAADVDGSGAAQNRTRAQLVGLALALDPSNRRARDLSDSLAAGDQPVPPSDEQAQRALGRAWNLLGWLEQPEAGDDGKALGDCLSDVLARMDPDHPQAPGRAEGERGQWNGWVAGLAAFRPQVPEPEPEGPEPNGQEMSSEPEPDPEPKRELLLLNQSTAMAPLWVVTDKEPKPMLRIVPVTAKARISGGPPNPQNFHSPHKVRIEGVGDGKFFNKQELGVRFTTALEARHGSLPKEITINYSVPEGVRLGGRNYGLTGAMLVAADALLSGVEPSGIAFAQLKNDGEIGLPAEFWRTLRALEGAGKGTLVMPVEAMEYLPSLLTLDMAEVFFTYEVLLAADAATLFDLASGQPPERLVEARKGFEDIRQARGTRSLGSFVGHDSTRERLGKVVELVPEHASARMLALRGTSKWPRQLERGIYAREIRASLDPVRSAFAKEWLQMTARDFQTAQDASRESLDTLTKLHGSVRDREELFEPALDMTREMGSVATAIRRGGMTFSIINVARPCLRQYVHTLKLLTSAAGDGDSYKIPFEDRLN